MADTEMDMWARSFARAKLEKKSVPELISVSADLNQKIKKLQELKSEALGVLAEKFKDMSPAQLLIVRDDKKLDADVRQLAGTALSAAHNKT